MDTIIIRTNIVTRENYNENGNLFNDFSPIFPYKSHFRLEWYLHSSTPGAMQDSVNISSWRGVTGFENCGALLTCDNDFLLRVPGKLTEEIPSGTSKDSIALSFGTLENGILPERGFIRIPDSTGESQNLMYSDFEKNGGTVTFTLASPHTFPNSIPSQSPAFVSQNTYFQAVNIPELSRPEIGKFVFDVNVYSEKLAQAAENASSRFLPIQGIELLPFSVDENNIYTERQSYLCETAAISVNLGEAGTPIDTPDPVINELAAMISAQAEKLGATVEIESVSAGDTAIIENVGTARNAKLKITLPQGPKGDAGKSGTITIGNVTAGSTPSVVNTGTSTDAILNFVLQPGETGKAGTIAIGNVTAGKEPSVINRGTASEAILDMVIPKGEAATIEIGNVKSGETPSIVNVGTENKAVWDVTLAKGDRGEPFQFDAREPRSYLSNYDGEGAGFLFLATDEGKYYIKQTDDYGDWSEGLPFPGIAPTIRIGSVTNSDTASASITGESPVFTLNLGLPKGEKGEKGNAGTAGGFGIFSLTTTTLRADEEATGSIETSGDNDAKNVYIKLGIPKGEKGDGMRFDARGSLAQLPQYDREKKDFTFLCTEGGVYYIKASDASGDWDGPFQFSGPKGDPGASKTLVTSLVDGGFMQVPGMPTLIQTNSGNTYPVSGGFVSSTASGFFIDPAPYLLADGQERFTGTWTIYTLNLPEE